MTVQTICDRCGMEYEWTGVSVGDAVYCCAGCANGTGCTCLGAPTAAVISPPGAVVAPPGSVVAPAGSVVTPPPDDDVIIT